jgi:serine protease inhibitor
MTRTTRFPALLVLALIAVACDGDTTGVEPIESLPRDLSVAELELIDASNDFAIDLLRQLPPSADTPNVFLSPLSASMALGMTMNGAAGETWVGMRDALRFGDLEEPAINQAYHDLVDLLLGLDPAVTFAVGNSIWGDRARIAFRADFLQRVRTSFDAEARAVDFADPATLDAINGWASDATRGRIDPLLDAIPGGMVAYLINAIYFQADWTLPFDRDRTRTAPFHPESGGPVNVEMMEGEVGRLVLRSPGGSGVSGVALPYGGGAFQGVAILPPEGETVAEFLDGLDAATWAGWMTELDLQMAAAGTDQRGLRVRLPKFELEWGSLLNQPLQRLGMEIAFDGAAADFSRLAEGAGPGDLVISEVLQKTYVRVDEEGTEAAAVTSVGIELTSAPPSLTFDRPFLFAIRERFSGTILFAGIIGDPSHGG